MKRLAVAMLVLVTVALIGCGKKKPAADTNKVADNGKTDDTGEKATPVTGGDDDKAAAPDPANEKLCARYANLKKMEADDREKALEGDPGADCAKAMATRTAADREKISDCMGACGDLESSIDCFDSYGSDDWAPCEGEGGDEGEGDGE